MNSSKEGLDQNLITPWGRVFVVACLFASINFASAAPRPSWAGLLPDWAPPLYRESFDEAFSWNSTNAQVVFDKYTFDESWSGYALQRSGTVVTPFFVQGVDPTTGQTNVSGTQGTIRFWFEPTTWSSASLPNGAGPGAVATLLELDAIGNNQSVTLWNLEISPDRTKLSLLAHSDSNPVLLIQTPISWQTNQSHLIVLSYSPEETALFIDGRLVEQGAGTAQVPPQVSALFVGSSLTGESVAGGDFDELSCFGPPPGSRFVHPLTEMDIQFYYNALSGMAALGPISAEEIAARENRITEWRAQGALSKGALGLNGGGMETMAARGTYGPISAGDCVTNVPVYLTNVWAGLETDGTMTVTFDVVGGTNGLIYDVFSTTNLATADDWIWVTNTPTCSTVIVTNQAVAQAFYILGTPLDSDGDGLTDAYEKLVSKTDPNDPDANGNGIPDWLEIQCGFNPNLPNNLGSLSTPGYSIFVANPKGSSNVP